MQRNYIDFLTRPFSTEAPPPYFRPLGGTCNLIQYIAEHGEPPTDVRVLEEGMENLRADWPKNLSQLQLHTCERLLLLAVEAHSKAWRAIDAAVAEALDHLEGLSENRA